MYQQSIARHLENLNRRGYDPRHVEAYMRLEHSTLDGLSATQFVLDVQIAIACIDDDGLAAAERCARSFGL